MLGNPELERALLEQTYDGVMTVTGTSKQEVGGETVVTPDAVLHDEYPVCASRFSGTPDAKTDANSGAGQLIRPRSTVRLIWLSPAGLPHCGSAVRRDLSAEIQRRKRGLSDASALSAVREGAT